jgi:cardiolipin synthase
MLWLIVHFTVVGLCFAAILLRPNRQPEARMAWLVVVLALPFVGVVAYLLLGSTQIGRARLERLRSISETLPPPEPGTTETAGAVTGPDTYAPLFRVGRSISGYAPVAGNRARLLPDSDAMIDALVADIDAAKDHVHLLFYIWLADTNGTKVMDACARAALRGVACRVMVDSLGSRALVRGPAWQGMQAAGVHTAVALRIGNPLVRVFNGRIDLRNHRKIVVIDNRITYCGSQNCADPAFLPKARYGPWVDAVMRFEGPVVRQNQHLFASDWMAEVDEDLRDLVTMPAVPAVNGFTAQVVATGPSVRAGAMPEMFQSLMFAARRELFITTPYYVPNAAMQAALCAAANWGIRTTIIFPARNDDAAVGATARSYYGELIAAGVQVYEYGGGLLHAKTMTLDGEVTLIGSANMDRRSFELNYENNILLRDAAMTAEMRTRQHSYLALCRPVTAEDVQSWGWPRRMWQNAVSIISPLL